MSLRDEFRDQGNWLFRWRSYLPFLLILLFIPALPYIRRPMGSEQLQNAWELVCFGVSLSGLLVRFIVGGHVAPKTSGRNVYSQVANSVNTTGIYSTVRHPLYLGNYLMWLGIVMFCFVPWMVICFTLAFWLYYERIMFAEEEFLRGKFGETYTNWASQTPAFIPNVFKYRKPELPFSLRTALKKEYTGLFGLAVAFVCMDQFENFVVTRTFRIDTHWIVIGVACTIVYLTLMTLKKKTTLLKVSGR
ncbi:methyltransferase family protein [Planctomicrobium sp. SH668]|uniref:methyltransferase family protein n=1 Tax=Planctomicrobium sp. SH668 TaxID=3448126 RepID=UPI003F5BE2EF